MGEKFSQKNRKTMFNAEKLTVMFGLKSIPPRVINLFRGIPFSHEDKIHEHIQESLSLEKGEQREILLGVFTRACRFLQGGFLQKIPYFERKELPNKAG